MGFIFDPKIKPQAQQWLGEAMVATKREMQTSLPFAMDPVVYDFKINDNGSSAELLTASDAMLPDRYYALVLPGLLRSQMRDLSVNTRSELERLGNRFQQSSKHTATAGLLLNSILPASGNGDAQETSLKQILADCGFDRHQHDQIRDDLLSGRIGLAQNRLSSNTIIEDVGPSDVIDLRSGVQSKYADLGRAAIRDGKIAVVTLAAGVGSRWTEGAGVCKALHPFNRFAGRHRSFLEVHLAKNRATSRACGQGSIPHVFTTSYLTDQPIREHLASHNNYDFDGTVHISTGRSVGLRMIPTVRDLRFLWEETAQQVLDEQQQKVRESLRSALINWAQTAGEGSDYTDNLPSQCIHPVGHWYEIPNMLRNGLLKQMLDQQSELEYLLLHNIDTLGANVDPAIFGHHIDSGSTLSFEVIGRRLEDRGGGLARVNGRPRLVEGLAMPDEQAEFSLTYYNSMTTWIDIDKMLAAFGLTRRELADEARVEQAVRDMALRLPTYITLKDVKKRWGHAQEDVFPVAQFEKLWGDMSALAEVDCQFFVTPMVRGQQLKTQAQLDPWKRDGSADYIDSICKWS